MPFPDMYEREDSGRRVTWKNPNPDNDHSVTGLNP